MLQDIGGKLECKVSYESWGGIWAERLSVAVWSKRLARTMGYAGDTQCSGNTKLMEPVNEKEPRTYWSRQFLSQFFQ